MVIPGDILLYRLSKIGINGQYFDFIEDIYNESAAKPKICNIIKVPKKRSQLSSASEPIRGTRKLSPGPKSADSVILSLLLKVGWLVGRVVIAYFGTNA